MGVRGVVRGAMESVLVRLPRTTRPGDRLILAYHNVVPNDWTPRGDRSLHLPLHKFEAQLRMIRNEAEIVSLMELLTTEARSDRRVAITFDDAYASAMELGVGACVAARVPCTVFVAPGLLGVVPPWDALANDGHWTEADRERFLWQQSGRGAPGDHESISPNGHATSATRDATLRISTLEQLVRCVGSASSNIRLGNHTLTHANLGALDAAQVERELYAADVWLHEHFADAHVPVVAYPYGISPSEPQAAVRSARTAWGLLVSGGWFGAREALAPHAVPRWNVPAGVSLAGFTTRLRGRLLRG